MTGQTTSGVTQYFLDDFTPGQTFAGPTRTLADEDFHLFARLTGDDHPIHYDDAFAKASRFGGKVTHGLHLMACTALGASTLSKHFEAAMIAFANQGCRFLKPVIVGDTITSSLEVESATPKPGRDWGVLRFIVRLTNQRGETVLEGHHEYFVRRRAA